MNSFAIAFHFSSGAAVVSYCTVSVTGAVPNAAEAGAEVSTPNKSAAEPNTAVVAVIDVLSGKVFFFIFTLHCSPLIEGDRR